MKLLLIETKKNKEVVDITDKIQSIVNDEFDDGLVNLFLKHTSAALTTADLDPGTKSDYLKVSENLIPKLEFNHPHNPSHFPDHFLSSAIGVNLSIPVIDGKLELGTWQRIVLLEFNGPKTREIVVTFIDEE